MPGLHLKFARTLDFGVLDGLAGVDELLQLTRDPVAPSTRRRPDNIKRTLLQAVFEKIWIVDEQIVGVDLTRPFAEVMNRRSATRLA
jgi:hypothetical protein